MEAPKWTTKINLEAPVRRIFGLILLTSATKTSSSDTPMLPSNILGQRAMRSSLGTKLRPSLSRLSCGKLILIFKMKSFYFFTVHYNSRKSGICWISANTWRYSFSIVDRLRHRQALTNFFASVFHAMSRAFERGACIFLVPVAKYSVCACLALNVGLFFSGSLVPPCSHGISGCPQLTIAELQNGPATPLLMRAEGCYQRASIPTAATPGFNDLDDIGKQLFTFSTCDEPHTYHLEPMKEADATRQPISLVLGFPLLIACS